MTEPPTDGVLAQLSVLVVEDEPFTRMVITRVIEGLGCAAVYQADDGGAGITILQNHAVDVIICDINMKPMTGIDLLRWLRTNSDPRKHGLPLIFLTAHPDPADITTANTFGYTAFLTKPIQPDLMRDALRRLCGPVVWEKV
ncbi:MAG: response regulator [Rhodospirillaceae bacterium]